MQPIRHLRGFQIHVAVDAADHDVEFGQRVFGKIHRAVAADVALEARKDAERQPAAVQSRTCLANATARFSSRPLAMASALE